MSTGGANLPAFDAARIGENPFVDDGSTFDDISYDAFVDLMMSEDLMDNYLLMVESFRFNGFNPILFLEMLKSCAKDAGRTPVEFKKDMLDLAAYYVARGTTINKRGAKDTFHKEATPRVAELIKLYKLKDNVPATGAKADIITLGRFSAAFPQIIGMFYGTNNVLGIGERGIVPNALMFPSASALIPTGPDYAPLYEKWLDWNVTFTKTINRRKNDAASKGKTDEEIKEDQRYWSSLAREQSPTTVETRIRFLGAFAPDLLSVADTAKYAALTAPKPAIVPAKIAVSGPKKTGKAEK